MGELICIYNVYQKKKGATNMHLQCISKEEMCIVEFMWCHKRGIMSLYQGYKNKREQKCE